MIAILMGPAGAGKTTVGTALAAALGWPFVDGDDFHSSENRMRLSRGEALTDAERASWLATLRGMIERAVEHGDSIVLACSALKRSYREALVPRGAREAGQVRFVYLDVSPDGLRARLRSRVGHFAPPVLLGSQLQTLEEPGPDEGVLTLEGEQPVAELVGRIRRALSE